MNAIALEKLGASEDMIKVASRKFALEAKPPPGAKQSNETLALGVSASDRNLSAGRIARTS